MNNTTLSDDPNFIFDGVFKITLTFISMLLAMKASNLCLVIIDYQGEKPEDEKSFFDVFIIDTMLTQLLALYFHEILYVICLFCPPFSLEASYHVAYVSYLINVFLLCNYLVGFYVKYIFVFQPDQVREIEPKVLRRKGLFWKLILSTFVFVFDGIDGKVKGSVTFTWMTKDPDGYQSVVGSGLGTLIVMAGAIGFCLIFKSKLRSVEEEEQRSFLGEYFKIVVAYGSFVLLVIFLVLTMRESYTYFIIHFIMLIFDIVVPTLYIKQNANLKLFESVSGECPPPILPWQMPDSIDLDAYFMEQAKKS